MKATILPGSREALWPEAVAFMTLLVCSASVCAAQAAPSAIPTPAVKPSAMKIPSELKLPVTPVKPATGPPSVPPPKPMPGVPPAVPGRPATYPPARQATVKSDPGSGRPSLSDDGKPRSIRRGDMRVTRSAGGQREIRIARADGSGVFVGRGGHGYVQRPWLHDRRQYIQRTYYAHGTTYARFYRPYSWHGRDLVVYTPVRYYVPAYYGWAYNSTAGIPYFGAPGIPFAVYYAPYFAPSPLESGPPYWLTDYMLSANLAETYQAQLDAANGVAPPPLDWVSAPVTPEVKRLIAEEVQRQLSRENAEARQVASNVDPDPASSGLGRMLDNTSHVFVAGADLQVLDSGGQECALSPGDVIQLASPPQAAADAARLVVLASEPRECAKGDVISVGLADLQDMQNGMRATVDDGLAAIQANSGQSGWPALPESAMGQGTTPPFAAFAPPPDPNAAAQIEEQVREADRAEQEAAGDQGQVWAAPQGLAPNPIASYGQNGSCADLASNAMALMQNPSPPYSAEVSTALIQIRYLGLDGYIRLNDGVAKLAEKIRGDLATQESRGGRDSYGIALNRAWINLLECMSRNAAP